MARINFQDDVEAQDEFWVLLGLAGNDRDKALGKLIRFFRLAQRAFGYDEPMTEASLIAKGLQDMIESGWAVAVQGGFHALGAEKHFAWYRQSVQRAIKGGQANKKRIEQASYPSGSIPASPLSLALSPALALSQKKEERGIKFQLTGENLTQAFDTWLETLAKMKMGRSNLLEREKEAIGRAIQRDGVLAVVSALRGVGNAPKDDFDSSWFSDVTRVLNPKNFLRFVNLGIQQVHKQKEGANG